MRFACVVAGVIVVFGLAAAVPAQEQDCTRRTLLGTTLSDARMEMILAPNSGATYRLDKQTGDVWTLQTERGFSASAHWQPLPTPKEADRPREINYQLLITPTGATYLLNVHTGATWSLRRGSNSSADWIAVTQGR